MIVPIRNLGKDGCLTDIDPFSSTFSQFTMATNVRFDNGYISRGPVNAVVGNLSLNQSPRFVMSYNTLDGQSHYDIANYNGTVTSWQSNTIGGSSVEVSITANTWANSNYDAPFTATVSGDVIFLNREDRVPWFKQKANNIFTPITTGSDWGSNWRCKTIRSVASVVVALNMTEGGNTHPTRVRTSDYFLWGSNPSSWVPTTTNSATNIDLDMSEPIVDGVVLRDSIVIYSKNETWLMEPSYDFNMFKYHRIFTNAGVINQNCVAEWDSAHYVFGDTDIWLHNTQQRQSIAYGKVKNFIFSTLIRDYSWQFFVVHQPRNNEMWFCYLSEDPYCAFPVGGAVGYPGCNRAAVFNYNSQTWTFYDLPYVTGAGLGVTVTGTKYSDFANNVTYDSIVGTYSSFTDLSKVSMMVITPQVNSASRGVISSAVRAFEVPDATTINGVFDTVATPPCTLYNDTVSMDDYSTNVRDYKWVKCIYPQAYMSKGSNPMYFDFEASDYSTDPPPVYSGNAQPYDGGVNYKLDFRMAGRFLGFNMVYDDKHPFALSGFDIEWARTGTR